MTNPKENDLSVWWVPQVPGKPFRAPVPSVEAGAMLLTVLAEYDAFQYINSIKPDYCNAGGLTMFEDGEWVDWQDEDTGEEDPEEVYPQPSLGYCSILP